MPSNAQSLNQLVHGLLQSRAVAAQNDFGVPNRPRAQEPDDILIHARRYGKATFDTPESWEEGGGAASPRNHAVRFLHLLPIARSFDGIGYILAVIVNGVFQPDHPPAVLGFFHRHADRNFVGPQFEEIESDFRDYP